MVEILHDLMYIYIYVPYYRTPILLAYEVYIRSCRTSTISSGDLVYLQLSGFCPEAFGIFLTGRYSRPLTILPNLLGMLFKGPYDPCRRRIAHGLCCHYVGKMI